MYDSFRWLCIIATHEKDGCYSIIYLYAQKILHQLLYKMILTSPGQIQEAKTNPRSCAC